MNILFYFTVLVAATAGGRAAAARPCQFQSFKDPANGCVCDSFTVPLYKTMNEGHLDSRVFEQAACSQWPENASATSSLTSTTTHLTFVQVTYDVRNGSGHTSPEGKLYHTEEVSPIPGFLAQNSWTNSAGQKRYCPDLKGNWAHHTLDGEPITFNIETNEFDYDFESVCSHVDGPGYPNEFIGSSGSSQSVGTQRVAVAYSWCKNHWLSAVSAVVTNKTAVNDPKSTYLETAWYGPFTPSWMECPRNAAPCDAQDSDCVCSVPGLRAAYQCNPTTGPPTCAVEGITSIEECGIACEKSGFYAGWGFGPGCVCRDDQNDEKIICQEQEPEPEPSASSPSPSSNKKGLTIGVGIAIVAASLVAVAGFLVLYRRRKTQQRREERENDLLNSDEFHSV